MFNLLCDGLGDYSSVPYSNIMQFGGPILYMIVQSFFAFAVLVYVDSGSPLPAFLYRSRLKGIHHDPDDTRSSDVIEEKDRLLAGAPDMLQVLGLKKRYGMSKQLAVNDVSFGVETGVNFALIGPNGAGKTTTLAVIRGVVSLVEANRGV
jgi:ATP-binding cassette subfamily A (ABC1) protein 3